MARVVTMNLSQARERAALAREHLQIAAERLEMCRLRPDRSSEAQAAASNAVLAAIAASDALCGQALGQHAADHDHRAATTLLRTVEPDGPRLANKLGRLLSDKTVLQYGTFCTRATAEQAVRDARSLVDAVDSRGM
ncbi:hypothetical protein [Cellulomonas sp. KH9]|uniref:hypothetical protein n=1 Tax=Cellulomonas sp. KH9 TaxID=1855324 RepID=UPI0008EBCB5F|nr:hypothetical protein [Cellulomonas sp. KH9]SFK44816.1 hypothetical protein SAMN05216467_3361 [Cellulomonas sp. KH9]